MIVSFRDEGTEDVFNGRNTQAARKVCPQIVWRIAVRKLDQLDSVELLEDLRIPPGNRLQALRANRSGRYSIRVNDQYRVCFTWSSQGPADVEIVDYH
jgi:proteic killer suppression protein